MGEIPTIDIDRRFRDGTNNRVAANEGEEGRESRPGPAQATRRPDEEVGRTAKTNRREGRRVPAGAVQRRRNGAAPGASVRGDTGTGREARDEEQEEAGEEVALGAAGSVQVQVPPVEAPRTENGETATEGCRSEGRSRRSAQDPRTRPRIPGGSILAMVAEYEGEERIGFRS